MENKGLIPAQAGGEPGCKSLITAFRKKKKKNRFKQKFRLCLCMNPSDPFAANSSLKAAAFY